MDQVKKIMGLVFAQRFWILCGLVTLLPVGGWFTTTSQMREFTAGRKTAIDQKISAAKALQAKQHHPNDASHKSMDELRNRITAKVADAWALQYERQKELLVWPKGLLPDFIKIVDKIRPLEIVQPPATPTDEVLNRELRERYRNYIAQELPKLAKKIGATWQVQELVEGSDPSASMQPGVPGSPGVDATGRPLVADKVVWSPTDQAALRNRYDWSTTVGQVPRTIDVLYAQEDLWVMSALMDVIAKTNEAATGRYNAVVKDISYISLGRDVGGSTGQVLRANALGGQGGMMGSGMMGDGGMMGSGMMGSGMMGMGAAGSLSGSAGGEGASSAAGMAGGAEAGMGMSGMTSMGSGMTGVSLDPAENRYVDPDYKPVPAATLRTAITSDSQDPANAFLVVAKRIPIRLGLTVDQRKINRLITACGNAPLMVEVRQVRFNRQSGPSAGAGGMMGGGMMGGGMMGGGMMGGGMMGGMSGMSGMSGMMGGGMMSAGSPEGFSGGGMGGMAGMMGEGGYGGTDTNQAGSDVSPHDKPVEVYGVVYIYNPVNVKKLGIENKEVEETPPATPAPAEVPPAAVAAPPAGAPPAGAPPAGAPPAEALPAGAGGAVGGVAVPPAGAAPPAAGGAPPAGAPAAVAPGAAAVPPAGGGPAGAAPAAGAAGAVAPPGGAPGPAAPAGAPAPAPGA